MEKKKTPFRASKSTGDLSNLKREKDSAMKSSRSTNTPSKLEEKKKNNVEVSENTLSKLEEKKNNNVEVSEKDTTPVGIPALSRSPKKQQKTVEDYERDLVGCKLQIAMSLIKFHDLQAKLVKAKKDFLSRKSKKVRSSSGIASVAAVPSIEDCRRLVHFYEQELVRCNNYIQLKENEFYRVRLIWREMKKTRDGGGILPVPTIIIN